jgi:hypothetical protein
MTVCIFHEIWYEGEHDEEHRLYVFSSLTKLEEWRGNRVGNVEIAVVDSGEPAV